MDIVPVTQEESFTPNKVEMVGDEDRTIVQDKDEDLPESSTITDPNKGTSSPTEETSKPNQNEKEEVTSPDKMQNNTTGAVEPSVTMD